MTYGMIEEKKFKKNLELVKNCHHNLLDQYDHKNDIAFLVVSNFVGEQLNKIKKSNEVILQYSEVIFEKIDDLNKYEISFCSELEQIKNYGINNYSVEEYEQIMQTLLDVYLDEIDNIKDIEVEKWHKSILVSTRKNDMEDIQIALHAVDRFNGSKFSNKLLEIDFEKINTVPNIDSINGLLNFNGQILIDKYKKNYVVFNLAELNEDNKWVRSPNIYVNDDTTIQKIVNYSHKEKLQVDIKNKVKEVEHGM